MIELLENEYFIPLKNYEEKYEISNYGRVKESASLKILHRVKVPKSGFLITLHIEGKKKIINSGMTVAKNFIDNPENLVNVRYVDGDKFNCHVSNIEWSRKSTNKNDKNYAGIDNKIYEDEIFVDIIGYEGLYQISNYGKVLALRYKNTHEQLLQPVIKKSGYVVYNLNKDGKYTYPRSHRLVALHFIENKNNHPFVNHIDGNKLNNQVSNLEWCSMEYNNRHAKETGLLREPYTNTLKKLNEEKVKEIKSLLEQGKFMTDIAKIYGVSRDSISNIKYDITWKWVV